MGRKSILRKYCIFNAASLEATLTSPITSIEYLDSPCIQLQWTTADAVGTFRIEASIDCEVWTAIDGIAPVVNKANDHTLINLPLLACPFIRVVYTRTEGTGTLTGYVSAKSL